jgi:hypothetical protein
MPSLCAAGAPAMTDMARVSDANLAPEPKIVLRHMNGKIGKIPRRYHAPYGELRAAEEMVILSDCRNEC